MNEQEFKDRTKRFALRVIRLVEALPRKQTAQVIGKQLHLSRHFADDSGKSAIQNLKSKIRYASVGLRRESPVAAMTPVKQYRNSRRRARPIYVRLPISHSKYLDVIKWLVRGPRDRKAIRRIVINSDQLALAYGLAAERLIYGLKKDFDSPGARRVDVYRRGLDHSIAKISWYKRFNANRDVILRVGRFNAVA